MKEKIVVLDTNVLLHDPDAPNRFGNLRVVLPMQVVEEIDRFKKDHSEKGMPEEFQDFWIPIGNRAALPMESKSKGVTRAFCRLFFVRQRH